MSPKTRTTIAATLIAAFVLGCSSNEKTGTGPSRHELLGTWDSYAVRTTEFGESLCVWHERSWHFATITWADSIFLVDIGGGAPDSLDPCKIVSIDATAGTWTAWDDSMLAKRAMSDGAVDTFIYRVAGDTLSVRHISWAPEFSITMERRR